MATRTHCPSCHHRLSPLAAECPVCGLSLAPAALPRPLLFQASALGSGSGAAPSAPRGQVAQTVQGNPVAQGPRNPEPRIVLAAPALGRVAPVDLEPPRPLDRAATPRLPLPGRPPALSGAAGLADPPFPQPLPRSAQAASDTPSFLPMVRLEMMEALQLILVNALLALMACLLVRSGPARLYHELWLLLAPLHLSVSWALFMVPLVLTGQTLLMGRLELSVEGEAPERRLSFSLLHLLSVALFPLSFLCLLLSPGHRTLAELLTGQEILTRPASRMR